MINCENCRRYKKSCTGGLAKEQCEKIKLPKTNADRFRAMTDEELAMLIHDIVQAEMWRVQVRECLTTETGWLDWLKQGVTND